MIPSESGVKESRIESLVAIIRRDKTATIYVNDDLNLIIGVVPKQRVNKGDYVRINDIAEIQDLKFDGIDIPLDAGVVVVLSYGWRKGLFFDFQPTSKDKGRRDYSISSLLGGYYAYLLFQQMFKISEEEWEKMIGYGWFPFIGIPQELVAKLLRHVRSGRNPDTSLPEVEEYLRRCIRERLVAWSQRSAFADHMIFIERAVSRFIDGDYISANSIIYPRIEGLMRNHFRNISSSGKASQQALVNAVVSSKADSTMYSTLLPQRFRQFLKEVYFANFDPDSPRGLSRNTVGHGVANADEFNAKGVVLGLLAIDQIFYYVT